MVAELFDGFVSAVGFCCCCFLFTFEFFRMLFGAVVVEGGCEFFNIPFGLLSKKSFGSVSEKEIYESI